MADRIPMQVRGRRPRFFDNAGTDELVSMMIETMAELWTVKERLLRLEQAAERHGIPLATWTEAYEPTPTEQEALASERRRMIANVLRSIEAEHAERAQVQAEIDGTPVQRERPSPRAA